MSTKTAPQPPVASLSRNFALDAAGQLWRGGKLVTKLHLPDTRGSCAGLWWEGESTALTGERIIYCSITGTNTRLRCIVPKSGPVHWDLGSATAQEVLDSFRELELQHSRSAAEGKGKGGDVECQGTM